MEPGRKEHFPADEDQHHRQAVLEQVEALGHVGKQEVHRTQPHDGEDVGREHYERIARDRKDGRGLSTANTRALASIIINTRNIGVA